MSVLKAFRTNTGLSQEKMAAVLGVSLSMYAKVEQGVAQPSRRFMQKLKAQFPHANIDDIFFTHNSNNIAVVAQEA